MITQIELQSLRIVTRRRDRLQAAENKHERKLFQQIEKLNNARSKISDNAKQSGR